MTIRGCMASPGSRTVMISDADTERAIHPIQKAGSKLIGWREAQRGSAEELSTEAPRQPQASATGPLAPPHLPIPPCRGQWAPHEQKKAFLPSPLRTYLERKLIARTS